MLFTVSWNNLLDRLDDLPEGLNSSRHSRRSDFELHSQRTGETESVRENRTLIPPDGTLPGRSGFFVGPDLHEVVIGIPEVY